MRRNDSELNNLLASGSIPEAYFGQTLSAANAKIHNDAMRASVQTLKIHFEQETKQNAQLQTELATAARTIALLHDQYDEIRAELMRQNRETQKAVIAEATSLTATAARTLGTAMRKVTDNLNAQMSALQHPAKPSRRCYPHSRRSYTKSQNND